MVDRLRAYPPKAVGEAIASELRSLNRARGPGANDYGGGQTKARGHALPVYGMWAESLRRDGKISLADAEPRGWRYLLNDGGEYELVDYIGDDDGVHGCSTIMHGVVAEQ
jgi:hypothetical protein